MITIFRICICTKDINDTHSGAFESKLVNSFLVIWPVGISVDGNNRGALRMLLFLGLDDQVIVQ